MSAVTIEVDDILRDRLAEMDAAESALPTVDAPDFAEAHRRLEIARRAVAIHVRSLVRMAERLVVRDMVVQVADVGGVFREERCLSFAAALIEARRAAIAHPRCVVLVIDRERVDVDCGDGLTEDERDAVETVVRAGRAAAVPTGTITATRVVPDLSLPPKEAAEKWVREMLAGLEDA